MVWCCFGGGGGDAVVQESTQLPIQHPGVVKTATSPEFSELSSAAATKTGTNFLSGNTASLSALTSWDNLSGDNHLNVLSLEFSSLPGNWYERLSSVATRLVSKSGAALCFVSILDSAHDKFIVVHVTGKDPGCISITPLGSRFLSLRGAPPPPHQTAINSDAGLHQNSVQVLQVLQAPVLYSFSDPLHPSRQISQPPHDWQAAHDAHGFSDFCALPLLHDKSVVGAVTLAFTSPPVASTPKLPVIPPQRLRPSSNVSPAPVCPLMACDEQMLRMLGLVLSAVLIGQDMPLAEQVAEIMSGVYEARNLQQAISTITVGAEHVLHLTTRVSVSSSLALLVAGKSASPCVSTQSVSAAVPLSGSASGRAIFFEEHPTTSISRLDSRTHGGGANAGRAVGGQGEPGNRSRLQRPNMAMDSAPNGALNTAGSFRERPSGPLSGQQRALPAGGAANSLQENDLHSSQPEGSQVQARSLGLRQTLLANLPSTGTVILDCASYMQQVGCPKRDLYLLSSCKGVPPFSLAIAPAALKDGDAVQLVLYSAISMRLPQELLNEILAQSQHLATFVLAPLLLQKIMNGNLAGEWALLVGKCAVQHSRSGLPEVAAGVMDVSTASLAATGVVNTGGKDCDAGGSPEVRNAQRPQPSGPASSNVPVSAGELVTSAHDGALQIAPPSSPTGAAGLGGPRSRVAQLPASLTVKSALTGASSSAALPTGAVSEPVLGTQPSGVPSREMQAAVLSTAVGGAFVGDTRTHMAMLVASFKDTINALQGSRSGEADELSVLKLGKVLGRGGSGLVFQGYLHLGLEVAVKLFENPDDTDPDTLSPSNSNSNVGSTVSASDEAAAAALGGGGGGANPPTTNSKESRDSKGSSATVANNTSKEGGGGAAGGGGGGASQSATAAAAAQQSASKATAQMTKRQRDLLRNALELGVTSSLSHPNIVQGYCHWVNVVLMQDASANRCWLMGLAEYMALAPPGSPPPPLCSALVMEYCDMGSLIHAIKRGTFGSGADGKPNMELVYMCLLEIALALRHLHTARLAHCDLKPGNVLLRPSPRDPRGFVCKLGDFGYAAILKDGLLPGRPAVLPDEACGTLQYMAPELFVAGRPVDASIDIYAFGMLMWELVTGKTPYSENEYASRALMKAVYHGKQPAFPDGALQAYRNLAMCCWSGDPTLRPSATVLVKLLRQQLESLKQQASAIAMGPGPGGPSART